MSWSKKWCHHCNKWVATPFPDWSCTFEQDLSERIYSYLITSVENLLLKYSNKLEKCVIGMAWERAANKVIGISTNIYVYIFFYFATLWFFKEVVLHHGRWNDLRRRRVVRMSIKTKLSDTLFCGELSATKRSISEIATWIHPNSKNSCIISQAYQNGAQYCSYWACKLRINLNRRVIIKPKPVNQTRNAQ